MNTQSNYDNDKTPADLRDIAHEIDLYSASERAAAGAGFEARVHAATVDALTPPALKLHSAPMVPARRRFSLPLQLAAAVALVSTIALSYLALNGRVKPDNLVIGTDTTASAISDIEHLLAVSASEDLVDAELDILKADTQSLSEGIRSNPTPEGGAL